MSRMPRAGWLAVGGVAAALGAEQWQLPAALAAAAALGALLRLASADGTRRALPWLAVGALLVFGRVAAGAAFTSAEPAVPLDRTATRHSAVVLTVGSTAGGQQRATLELLPPAPPERIYAWLPRYPALIAGDRIGVAGRLEPAPLDGGFGEYLKRNEISHTIRSRELERTAGADSPSAALEQLRRGAGELVARSLPEPQAGLGAALIIGLRDRVAGDVAEDFRMSGLSHVVAISGWHVAMVAGVLSALLSGLSRRRRSLALVVAICGYAIVAGGAPSVVRAALMAGAVLLARESGRRGHAAAALGLAVLAMLLVEPATVADAGFQLSVAATAGLLCWGSSLAEWLHRHVAPATPRWLVESLAVSLAAQAATLPLVLFHFGRLSLVAPLANLVVAPIVAPAMLAAALALACGALAAAGVPAVLLAPINLLGSLALGAMIWIADLTAALPLASIELLPPLDLLGAGLAGLAVITLLRRRSGRATTALDPTGVDRVRDNGNQPHASRPTGGRLRAAAVAGGLALVLVATLVAAARPDGRLHMTVLDVGQGDAILLSGPAGGRMLIDTGPDPDRLVTLLDQHVPAWDRRIDLVALTHPHEDHVAGLALLLDRYRIGGIVEPGMIGPGPGDAAFRRRLAELGRRTRAVAAGDRLTLDGIEIVIHWPLPGRVPLRALDSGKSINNVSLVLDLRFGQRRVVLTGDVEEDVDPQLLARGLARAGERLDVLKVAHHGSGSATTDAFVEQLRPRVAVVSAGRDNPYGHPSPRTVARLEAAGAQLFRTDLDGTVTITTDGADLRASAGGGRPAERRATRRPPLGVGFCPLPRPAAGRRPPYNRRNDRSQPARCGCPVALARPARLARSALRRSGRGSRLPGRASGSARASPQRGVDRHGGAAA